MKLSSRDKEILAVAHLRASASPKELAHDLGLREHTVRDALNRLEQEGVITPRTMVDVHLLGFTQFSAFFSAIHHQRENQVNLQKLILESEHTSDVFGLGGDYQYGAVITVEDITDAQNFLERISNSSGIEIIEKSLALRTSTTIYQRNYLNNVSTNRESITYKKTNKRLRIDADDHRIIAALNAIQHTSLRDLAKKLEMPHSTLTNKYKKLEEAGVIIGSVYGMSCAALGAQSFRLLVYTKGFDFAAEQDLHRYALSNPNVLCLFQMMGSWDYELEVEVYEARDTFELVQDLYEVLKERVLTIKTIPILSFPKSSSCSKRISSK